MEITKDFKIKPKTDIVFPATDDACMNLAAHPTHKVFVASVNSSEEIIRAGNNINGRYLFTKGKVIKTEPSKNIRTIDSKDTMHYQKCSRFSQDGKIYTAGTSTGQFTTWKWPEMEQTGSMEFKKEIAEISIQGNLAIVTTAGTLSMVALDKAKIRTALDIGKASITPSEFRSAL